MCAMAAGSTPLTYSVALSVPAALRVVRTEPAGSLSHMFSDVAPCAAFLLVQNEQPLVFNSLQKC